MRILILTALITTISLQAVSPCNTKKITRTELIQDSHNAGAILEQAVSYLEKHMDHIEDVAKIEGQKLEAENEQEHEDLVISYGLFLISLFRMRQQAACFIDASASAVPTAIWNAMGGMFSLFSNDILVEAIGEAIEWIADHRDDVWHPESTQMELKPEAEWVQLRADAADAYVAFLYKLAGEFGWQPKA